MAQYTPEEIARIQQMADADPQVQGIVQRIKAQGGARHSGGTNVYGYNPTYLPEGLHLEARTGRVVEPENWSKEWMTAVPIVASAGVGGMAAGGALGAMGGGGVGAGGLGPGLNAAAAGNAAHAAGGGLMMGTGGLAALGGAAAGVPTAASLIGESAIPTIASRAIGNGMGTDPSLNGMTNGIGDSVWDSTLGKWVKKAGGALGTDAANKLTGGATDGIPEWARAAIAAMSGLPALLADKGPSDAENAYAEQARRLLAQQEQRTQYQNPLYEAVTRMAWNLQPNSGNNNGSAYPINSLNDVKIPGMP